MDQHSQNIEKIFKEAFEQHTMMPSAKVLRRIKVRLLMSDFFSFKPRKFNIVYSTLIVGSTVSLLLVANKSGYFSRGSKNIEVATTPNTLKAEDKDIDRTITNESNIGVNRDSDKSATKKMFSAAFDISDDKGCAPYTVYFRNHSEMASAYIWDYGDGSGSSEKNPSYTYKKPGQYLATLTIKGKEGETDVFSKKIIVLQSPKADIAIDTEHSEIAQKKIIFNNKSVGGTSYSWDFGDNVRVSEKDATHTYSDFGNYKVTFIAKSDNGCADTATLNNNFIEKNYELEFPFSFRPNTGGDPGNNGFYASADAESFTFYPKNYGSKIYELKIYAPNGIEVFNTTNIQQGWNGYIKGRLAPAGNYRYEVKGIYPNGKPFDMKGTFKVIIEDYYQN